MTINVYIYIYIIYITQKLLSGDDKKRKMEVEKIGYGQAMRLKWISQEKDASNPKLIHVVSNVVDAEKMPQDDVLHLLQKVHNCEYSTIDATTLGNLRKRKLVQQVTTKHFTIGKGPKFTTNLSSLKKETDLSAEMLAKGSWRDVEFKEYNFDAKGKKTDNGHLHPLLKVRTEFRKIFLEMGFEEMKTNSYVESSFWNFDALFQPQQHPARDAHDTFFLSNPSTTPVDRLPADYLKRVKSVHEKGGYGSTGYVYDWKVEEAQKNLLRTHTTAVSSRYLYQLAQEYQKTGVFKPRKFFSIDRVFRNEMPDATHLCEFNQIEGMVIDRNLSLGDLIGLFTTFFEKIGITDLKFKPAYNPYTEPSMEIFGYQPQLAKWIEVGNSGVFRPEMLEPMGWPSDVTVLAWGLSLERPTMILYEVDNIRDLVGHRVPLDSIYKNPICRLVKD